MSTTLGARSTYTSAASPRELAPVAPEERIQALDLLRGWAMFGVLWSNLNDWYSPTDESTTIDRALGWTQEWLLEGRFFTLLCFLFGAGFGIQLARAAARGVDVTRTYYRRSVALLAIGLVHATLIWSGDILTLYALVALSLVLFRDASPRRLLVFAVVSWLAMPYLVSLVRFAAGQRYPVPFASTTTRDWVIAHGTWMQIAPIRITTIFEWFQRWGLRTYFMVLGMFLAGLWAVKSGFLQRLADDPRTARRLLTWTVLASAVGWALSSLIERLWKPGSILSLRSVVLQVLGIGGEPMALAYAAVLVVVWHTSRGNRLLRPLAATGRMALTTYLTQSVVCTLLFFGYGAGLYGRFSYSAIFALTLALFGIQMAVSIWWLSRYRFGPVEWVWRTLTYGRPPQMRIS